MSRTHGGRRRSNKHICMQAWHALRVRSSIGISIMIRIMIRINKDLLSDLDQDQGLDWDQNLLG